MKLGDDVKNKGKISPIIFLVFGLLLMILVSGMSVRNYVKESKSQNNSQKISYEKTKNKIFFNETKQNFANVSLKIFKSRKVLELYGDKKIIGRFKIGLGQQKSGPKEKEGDSKTPEGNYYVCYINTNSKYKYFFGISYPNVDDAERGLKKNMIGKVTYNEIKSAIDDRRMPPWHTALGGEIGIHGGGTKTDWTYGCIAMDNDDIAILNQYVKVGSSVYIYK